MPGSHSLKYYAKSFKKVKFNHTTLESCLKDQEVKKLSGWATNRARRYTRTAKRGSPYDSHRSV